MSGGTRQHWRRLKRATARRCFTVSDAHVINEQRRLPDQHPSLGWRKRKGKPKRPRLRFPAITQREQAWPILRAIRRSDAAQKVCDWLDAHPGPDARCSGEALLLGMCLAAAKWGRYLRSDVCSVINGLDATVLWELGLCDHTTFTPVTYAGVGSQMLRLERCPFTELMPEALRADLEDAFDDDKPRADLGMVWFTTDLLLASIPKKVRALITAISLDATAFPTYARVHDFTPQKEIDQEVREALERGEPVRDGISLTPDGKLVRCPHDPEATSGSRGASLATGHVKDKFTGTMPVLLSPCCDYSSRKGVVELGYDPSPYVIGASVDPAGRGRGPITRDAVLVLKALLPTLRLVVGDREFSESREKLVRPLHERGIAFIRDYKVADRKKVDMLLVGRKKKPLLQICGDFYPLWLPAEFQGAAPSGLSDNARQAWYDDRAKFRYVPNGRLGGKAVQFMCPQCAGNVVGAHNTRMGKFKHTRHPIGVPSLPTQDLQQWCCNGSINISINDLDWWQPLTWGTAGHQDVYYWGRSRIENCNSGLRNDEGLDPKSCRASGTRAHSMAVLALAVANNVELAAEDPLADPPATEFPQVQLSLLCILPAFQSSNGSNGSAATNGHNSQGVQLALPLRAPP